jgi:hypothetical protein
MKKFKKKFLKIISLFNQLDDTHPLKAIYIDMFIQIKDILKTNRLEDLLDVAKKLSDTISSKIDRSQQNIREVFLKKLKKTFEIWFDGVKKDIIYYMSLQPPLLELRALTNYECKPEGMFIKTPFWGLVLNNPKKWIEGSFHQIEPIYKVINQPQFKKKLDIDHLEDFNFWKNALDEIYQKSLSIYFKASRKSFKSLSDEDEADDWPKWPKNKNKLPQKVLIYCYKNQNDAIDDDDYIDDLKYQAKDIYKIFSKMIFKSLVAKANEFLTRKHGNQLQTNYIECQLMIECKKLKKMIKNQTSIHQIKT